MLVIYVLQYECVSYFTAEVPEGKVLQTDSPSITILAKGLTIFGTQYYGVFVYLISAQATVKFNLEGSTNKVSVNIDNSDCGARSGQYTISYKTTEVKNSVCPNNVKCTATQDKQVIETFGSNSRLLESLNNYIENASPKPQVFVPPMPTSRNQLAAEMQMLYCMNCADMSPYLRLNMSDPEPTLYVAVEERQGTSQSPVINVSSKAIGGFTDMFARLRSENSFSLSDSMMNAIAAGNVCGESTSVCRIPNGVGDVFKMTKLREWVDTVGGLEGVYAAYGKLVVIISACSAAALVVVVAAVVIVLKRRAVFKERKPQDAKQMKMYVM